MILKRRLVCGFLLLLFPWVTVFAFKRTAWGPVASTPLARQQGDPHAKVVIIEYSDFQCPSCARVQPTIHTLFDNYKGKIRLVYKFYPLTTIHRNAMNAAHAAQCAAEQAKFWPYQDQLFATQDAWKDLADPTTNFMAISSQVAMNAAVFNACYTDPSRLAIIQTDIAEAGTRQVNATPTFFVNDERLVGGVFTTDAARVIERELRK